MTPPPPPPGGYPGQPGWQQTPPPPPGPPVGPPVWQPTPPPGAPPGPPAWNQPEEDHTARNVVIAVIVVALVIILLAAAYAVTRPPAASLPVIIPTAAPSATKTPKATPTAEPTTEATAETTAEATAETPTEEPATAEPTGEPTAETPTEEPTAETPTEEPTAAGPTPEATNIPGVEDQEIIIGTPVVVGDTGFQQVSLLVQNISDLVKSYSLQGTFKAGDTITATASGYVSNHLAGTIRTPTLYVDGEPGATDTLTVAIDNMLIEEPNTPEGDVALQVQFGPPTINADDFPTIDVEVTNGSDSAISSLSVSAGVLRDDLLVGVGTGVLSDLAPGQTKTATLYVTGSIEDTDKLLLNVETVLLTE